MSAVKKTRKSLLDQILKSSDLKNPTMEDVEIINAIRVVATRIDEVVEEKLDDINEKMDIFVRQNENILTLLEEMNTDLEKHVSDQPAEADEMKGLITDVLDRLTDHIESHRIYETPLIMRGWSYATEHVWLTLLMISGFFVSLPWMVGISRLVFTALLAKVGIDAKALAPFGF